jgi:hypothetical protein
MTEACVLWDPAICGSVLPVVALSAADRETSSVCLPADARVFVFVDSAGLEHVLMLKGLRFAQLAVTGASVLSPCHLLTPLVVPPDGGRTRLAAIAEFNALVAGRGLDIGRSRDLVGARRLRFVLQALDGFLAGRSQRTTAEMLFGASRVWRDWNKSDACLRDQVRRAIGRGRRLMMGGYVSLLR